jgi:serine/threonine protein kinase
MIGKRAGDAKNADVDEAEDFVPLPLAADLPAGTVVGEYTLECKLGDGGMAAVYGATHPLIGKKAAVKVMNAALSLDLGLVERFVLEARAVNEIGHPNIVDVFSFGRLPDGRSYFVMEWLQGVTLYDRMWDRKMTLDEALDALDQICDALDAAHEKGIVHRDLKPANIFLSPVRGRREAVKLLDFGVAKLTLPIASSDGGSLPTPQTRNGFVVGTPEYIAPEQARAKDVDGKADVYALGVIAYEMILGQRPFLADNSADLVRMHLTDVPPAPRSLWPEIPPLLDELLQAMLAKEATVRPSASEVRDVLRELRDLADDWDLAAPMLTPMPGTQPASFTPRPKTKSRSAQRRNRQLRWQAMGLLLIGCGAGLGSGLITRFRHVSAPAVPAAIVLTQPAAPPTPRATVAPQPATATAAAIAAVHSATAPGPEGTLDVRVDAADARIEVDGRLIAEAASGAHVRLAAGAHDVDVSAPHRQHYRGHFAVVADSVVAMPVHLHRAGEKLAPPPSTRTAAAATNPSPPHRRDAQEKKKDDPDYLVDPFGAPR